MSYQTFKIQDTVNNYYYYTISDIDDPEFVLDIRDSYAEDQPDLPINTYFNIMGFDNATCTKAPEISPIQVINKSYPSDPKNMLTSDEYKKVIEEVLAEQKLKEEKKAARKNKKAEPKAAAEAKPKAKPRAKKTANVKIEPNGVVNFQ